MVRDYLDSLNDKQCEAVVHSGAPLLILAGAGSGKTRVITTKIAFLIQERGINPSQILAVTFTKKAANEMKERAVNLEPRAAGALSVWIMVLDMIFSSNRNVRIRWKL